MLCAEIFQIVPCALRKSALSKTQLFESSPQCSCQPFQLYRTITRVDSKLRISSFADFLWQDLRIDIVNKRWSPLKSWRLLGCVRREDNFVAYGTKILCSVIVKTDSFRDCMLQCHLAEETGSRCAFVLRL